MLSVLLPALQQTLLFLPLCFGIYLTYRIMATTDLTVEATFVLGAGAFAHLVTLNCNQYVAVLIAIAAAGAVGLVVALIQKMAKLNALITSILAIFMLYSINFKVLGRPNISLLSTNTLIQSLQMSHPAILWSGIGMLMLTLAITLCLLLHSRFGLLLRAFGDNNALLQHLAKNRLLILISGLVVSNGLAAFSGVLTAQVNGYADVNMGLGVALTAIGSMIIGLTVVNQLRGTHARFKAAYELFGCCLGVLTYFIAMNALLYLGLDPIYMKLALGVVLLFFLSSSQIKNRGEQHVESCA
ncbi:MAG: hypothetical protein A3F67_08225 [Verrucomicrobia bacterium RIFCSPHIGHO2_12_FULL_41_10]|nr:MAG: hypothetical protein A3F67_08225 [Verrucomicrobia bacterium RIFCSPHIGHO2_12_FULL_41_10]